MRILGLDLSLSSTGYVLLDEDHVVWFGTVAGGHLREVERLQHFDRWIRAELRDKRFSHVGIEGYSFGSVSHHHAIGELGGVIKLAVHAAGIPMLVVPPATWKKQLLGKGNLAKDQVRLEAFKRYGVEFASQDTLDAWAVAMYVRRQLLGLDKPEPKSRRRTKDLPRISATEEAHDEEGAPARRRTAGAAPAQALEGARGGLRPARA